MSSEKKDEAAQSATLRRIQRRRRIASVRKMIVAGAVLVAAIVAYCYAGRFSTPEPEQPESVAVREEQPKADRDVAPSRSEREVASAAIPAPSISIDQSDPLVRQLARALSTHPRFAAWLVNDDLIRRLVASVANISEGLSPRKQLPFLAPESPFQVIERDEQIFLDPRGGERYDDLAAAFASLDVDAVATVYRELRPLLFRAYAELGYASGDFDSALRTAIEELWATPLRDGEIELSPASVSYRYTDPELESMSGAQKQLFRMGLRNQRLVRSQLAAIARSLELVELPDPTSEQSAQ